MSKLKELMNYKEEITRLYFEELKSVIEISKMYNTSRSTMSEAMKRMGIKFRNSSETNRLYRKSVLDNMIGKKYNRLTIYDRDKSKFGNMIVSCECNDENKYSTHGYGILNGSIKSCGCWNLEVLSSREVHNKTHGLSRHKLYHIHKSMINRCYNPNNNTYKYYGSKGIEVCSEWNNPHDGFLEFYKWANNNGYEEGLSIDRIDSNGNYEPNNCRWITRSENVTRRNVEYWNEYKIKKGGN